MSDAALSHLLRDAAPDNLRIHIWTRAGGGYQINVSERGSGSWTVVHDDDPALGLAVALRQRGSGSPGRRIAHSSEPTFDAPDVQIDIEEAIATAVDPFEDMLG